MNKGPVSQFLQHHFRHFNAAALVDAAKGYDGSTEFYEKSGDASKRDKRGGITYVTQCIYHCHIRANGS